MNFSASLENTKYNSQARGLQVYSELTHPTAKYGRLNSVLAKTIYIGLDEIKPTHIFGTQQTQRTGIIIQANQNPTKISPISEITVNAKTTLAP